MDYFQCNGGVLYSLNRSHYGYWFIAKVPGVIRTGWTYFGMGRFKIKSGARDVTFKLDYPADISRDFFEEDNIRIDPNNKVVSNNFSYNTSQYFFESFKSMNGPIDHNGEFKITITYIDPNTGILNKVVFNKTVSQILGCQMNNLRDAESVFLLNELVTRNKTCNDVISILNKYYSGYSSPIFDEYRILINRVCNN